MDALRELALWQQQEYTAMKPGLGRIGTFLKAVGSPETAFPSIVVAGTNGKGSTARMIAAMLTGGGYKTGLYISPHLVSITERISVNGQEISLKTLAKLFTRYRLVARRCQLTYFECITGLCLVYFAQQQVDCAVLEVGLGGRFDAVNAVNRRMANVITEIGFDHTAVLGNTITAIAREKAGIITANVPVISGVHRAAAKKVLRDTARKCHTRLYEIGRDFSVNSAIHSVADRQHLSYKDSVGKIDLIVPLLGEYQTHNAAVAVQTVRLSKEYGFSVSNTQIQKSIRHVTWPGRFEVIKRSIGDKKQTVLLDGAHNPAAMEAFVKAFKKTRWGKQKRVVLFGVLKDKDYRTVIKQVAIVAKKVVFVPFDSPRRLSVETLTREWQRYLPKKQIVQGTSIEQVLTLIKNEPIVVAAGSLYMIGALKRGLKP